MLPYRVLGVGGSCSALLTWSSGKGAEGWGQGGSQSLSKGPHAPPGTVEKQWAVLKGHRL